MDEKTIDRVKNFPKRARTAFVLSVADAMASALPNAVKQGAIDDALRKAWSWAGGEDVSGKEIYGLAFNVDLVEQRLRLQRSEKESNQSNRVFPILAALYYAAWRAYGRDLMDNKIAVGEIPNDMNEMDEGIIDQIFQDASVFPDFEPRKILNVVERLSQLCSGENKSEWGRAIPKDCTS